MVPLYTMNLIMSKNQALILDRDWVINIAAPTGEYIMTPEQFKRAPWAQEIITILSQQDIWVFVATNQQQVGKGLINEDQLRLIHKKMLADIQKAWWRIDSIEYCPHLIADDCDCRKPKPGMIHTLLLQYPEVDVTQSLLVGDTITDIQAWQAAWLHTLLIEKDRIIDYKDQIIKFFQ